jgi:hypothetical protein
MKRSPVFQNRFASAARSAAGRLEKKINGSATAVIRGTRSTLEACAQPACISGQRPSASRAVDGRRIRCGMRSDTKCAYPRFLLKRHRIVRGSRPFAA